MIDRIGSYSREQLFRGTCSLLASNNLRQRRHYGRKWLVSIKHQNLHSFKEALILLCQSTLERRREAHFCGSSHFTKSESVFWMIVEIPYLIHFHYHCLLVVNFPQPLQQVIAPPLRFSCLKIGCQSALKAWQIYPGTTCDSVKDLLFQKFVVLVILWLKDVSIQPWTSWSMVSLKNTKILDWFRLVLICCCLYFYRLFTSRGFILARIFSCWILISQKQILSYQEWVFSLKFEYIKWKY